mmetsp:Transcript_10016/g.11496  ORF Transcript_10016/g.11496 Transcript_10016/m.11496 type:complete len:103 (-) Transcript_10016:590-898(-)
MVHLGPLGGLTGGTSKREVLRLYREILRTANAFYWPNDEGEPWSAVLKRSARKEFEQARHEKDPLIVARLVVVGQQCVNETRNRFNDMEEEIKNRVKNTRNR